MRYEVRVGERSLRVDVGPYDRFLLDGSIVAADVTETVRGLQWRVRIDGAVHEVTVLRDEPFRLLVDGAEVTVSVTDERVLSGRRTRLSAPTGRHELRAPMPGLLKAVHVSVGALVERGQPIATLEAMKMENELRAPTRARVAKIPEEAGTKVEGGAILAVLVEEAQG